MSLSQRFRWKIIVLSIQGVGVSLSVLLIFLTYLSRDQVEARLQSLAMQKVESYAASVLDASEKTDSGGTSKLLSALSRRFAEETEVLQGQRKDTIAALVAYALSDQCDDNCVMFTGGAAMILEASRVQKIAELEIGQKTVADLIAARYEKTVAALVSDIRQFGTVNVIVLVLMAVLVVFKDHLNLQTTTFSVALTGYTAWASYSYFFRQNWAMTILTQNWAAPAYQAGMIFVMFLLIDWVFLRGIVTRIVGNVISSVIPG
ncbi:hypothetical protein [Celeribacter sp.]|uniref:hypothetical protein n=1 Tax=Celeribacter sp. TaxID=1890673 RepID=UPI003A92A762